MIELIDKDSKIVIITIFLIHKKLGERQTV